MYNYVDENGVAIIGNIVNKKVNELKQDLDNLTSYMTNGNNLSYDDFTYTGTISTAKNIYTTVFLEQGKTYYYGRRDGTIINSSYTEIQSYDGTETIEIIQNWGTTIGIDLNFQFIWEHESGLYKFHITSSSAYAQEPQNMINSLFIGENKINYVKGIIYLVSKNSAKLNGLTVDEVIETARNGNKYCDVCCLGDSLTQGAGAPAYNYVNQLNSLLNGQAAFRFGVGGENSSQIAVRQGGVPCFVMPTTIPSDKTTIEIEIKNSVGGKVQFGNINGLLFGVSTCYIGGIKGTLSVSDDKTHTYFTRNESGDSYTFDRPILFVSEIAKEHIDDVFVIWAGTNDNITANGIDNTFNAIDNMIEFLPHKKYIVVGMTSEQYMSNIDDINVKFSVKYGSHFLNIRKYLELYGLSDNSITTETHTQYNDSAIADELYADGTHFNQYGYYSVAKAIYLFGKDKGYFA